MTNCDTNNNNNTNNNNANNNNNNTNNNNNINNGSNDNPNNNEKGNTERITISTRPASVKAKVGKKKLTCRVSVAGNRWMKLLNYFRSSRVDRLIFVKYTGGTRANVVMWKKYNAGGKIR